MIKSSLLGALLVLKEIGEQGFVKHAPSKMLSSEDLLDDTSDGSAPPPKGMPMTPETSSALPIKLRRRLSISAENLITEERMRRWVSATVTALAQLQSVIPDKQLFVPYTIESRTGCEYGRAAMFLYHPFISQEDHSNTKYSNSRSKSTKT